MKRSSFEKTDWAAGLEFQDSLECEVCGASPAAYDSQNLGDDAGPVCRECLPDAIWDVLERMDEVELEE